MRKTTEGIAMGAEDRYCKTYSISWERNRSRTDFICATVCVLAGVIKKITLAGLDQDWGECLIIKNRTGQFPALDILFKQICLRAGLFGPAPRSPCP